MYYNRAIKNRNPIQQEVNKMKKKWTTFEDATVQYAEYAGVIPNELDMIDMYHRYRSEWKAFDGFVDWLVYNVEAKK